MKKKINLLTKLEKYQRLEKIFFWIKIFSFIFVLFVILINIIFNFFFLSKKGEIEELNRKKITLLQFISQQAPIEAKYQIFSQNFNLLKKFLNEDANFFPYYQLINQSLQSATTGAVLRSIEISKDKKINFEVSFSTLEEMLNFLETIERGDFIKNFQKLTLKSFSLKKNQQTQTNEFQLDFEGVFKENL